jgi:hypothetical protein
MVIPTLTLINRNRMSVMTKKPCIIAGFHP